ncbi:MAG TPA: GH116 family glycosyl hydrolase [Bryobacteraceae bacterium]|nr:GH116 family glycosyl hydrolase [Bryobacteraceae bacterium]
MRISRRHFVAGSTVLAGAPGGTGRAASPPSPGRTFSGENLREIAFPLGGIGTGTVSLGGFGNLRDWEIFNRPAKGATLPFTFAALRLEGGGLAKPLIRVLERQPFAPYRGGGHGVARETGAGIPHLRDAVFTGAYPFAEIGFRDPRLPVEISLEAFNPMVPLETDDSSLPVAILTYRLVSRAKTRITAALAFSIMNPVGHDGIAPLHQRRAPLFGQNLNEFRNQDGHRGLLLTSGKYPRDSSRYGSMALVTPARDVSYRLEWDHGPWWDDFQKWWDEFLAKGRFPSEPSKPSAEGATEYATLAAHFTLDPGETRDIPWVLAWHFPNTETYWNAKAERGKPLPNQYGTRWPSAWEPAAYTLTNLAGLRERSRRYRDTLYSSTLPAPVIDAVSSQASILRTNTVMVLEGRKTLAFEGCNDNSGCCPMNCTHVYNYEQSIAHLYPDLERSMREIDFLTNMRPDGSMSFRTPVPLQPGGNKTHPAADGQMGCVMKVYREWQLGVGDEWLRKLWPQVKRALEYAWVNWDPDRDGVMEGEQHNTYDIEFYGPNSMMGSLYLGALVAAARMAEHLGDTASAKTYRGMAERGAARLDRELYNGEYYVQRVDESHPKAGKYQYGEGCLSDQLLGQWFAEVVNLGKLLPHPHIQSTLDAIFRYNFREEFETLANAQRIYALNDEKGLLLCSWPKGKRPALPFVYSDEVWTGIEYQVAAHLIYEGRVKEGLAIVEAVRERYDGARRNPWDEVECGHHYARAMSSWSLLTALSGFAYSAPRRDLRFRPRHSPADFRCLYSTGTAWGGYAQRHTKARLEAELAVEGGRLELTTLRLPFDKTSARAAAPAGATVQVADGEAAVRFASPVDLRGGAKLKVVLE